jgi:hypothetical protein
MAGDADGLDWRARLRLYLGIGRQPTTSELVLQALVALLLVVTGAIGLVAQRGDAVMLVVRVVQLAGGIGLAAMAVRTWRRRPA